MDPHAHLKTLDAARRVAEASGVNTTGWVVYHPSQPITSVPLLLSDVERQRLTRRYSLIGGVSEHFHPEDH